MRNISVLTVQKRIKTRALKIWTLFVCTRQNTRHCARFQHNIYLTKRQTFIQQENIEMIWTELVRFRPRGGQVLAPFCHTCPNKKCSLFVCIDLFLKAGSHVLDVCVQKGKARFCCASCFQLVHMCVTVCYGILLYIIVNMYKLSLLLWKLSLRFFFRGQGTHLVKVISNCSLFSQLDDILMNFVCVCTHACVCVCLSLKSKK